MGGCVYCLPKAKTTSSRTFFFEVSVGWGECCAGARGSTGDGGKSARTVGRPLEQHRAGAGVLLRHLEELLHRSPLLPRSSPMSPLRWKFFGFHLFFSTDRKKPLAFAPPHHTRGAACILEEEEEGRRRGSSVKLSPHVASGLKEKLDTSGAQQHP